MRGSKGGDNVIEKTGVDFILEVNDRHSREFCDPGVSSRRRLYRAEHPTEIAAFKCMDGRVHLPAVTGAPLGVIQPWRNLGGRFNLGWPLLGDTVRGLHEYAITKGRHVLDLVTYHYARGDEHRGCAGFEYDTEAAQNFSAELKASFDHVHGRGAAFAVQVGLETDLEALILHGNHCEVADLSELGALSEGELRSLLREFYDDWPERVVEDFLPLVTGNITHVAEVRSSGRPLVDTEHREWMLGLGRGFDWLHIPNTALIVGPFEPNLETPIKTAASVIQRNLEAGRIDGRKVVLMTSAPYREEVGFERRYAEEKARFLMTVLRGVVEENFPLLWEQGLETITATVDLTTRKLDVLNIVGEGQEIKAA